MTLAAAFGMLAACGAASAQDLEPKAYSASPVGTAFVVTGLSRSNGGILFDPSLPITDADAKINGLVLAAGYTFDLAGATGLVTASTPYAWGDIAGKVMEQAAAITRSGLGDTRVKLSVNLVGNPAMRAREFVRAPRKTIVGTSLTVAVPTGQYDPAKLINLGTNRWAFKPEVGVSVPAGRWDVDAYAGVWLYTSNDAAYPGEVKRAQQPLLALQGHVSYTFRPRLWVAVDATWYAGGAIRVDDGDPAARLNNSRIGATLSLPMGQWQSLKFAYSNGVVVRTGTDFRTYSVGWQRVWFTKR